MRLIDADRLEGEMYHNAFEIDTDLQKWDSGCWIRYKMFENVIEEQPTVKAIPIEWVKRYAKKGGRVVNILFPFEIEMMLEDWKKENEID